MRHFTQVHVLTAYPPSNPNRDDQGRPKSAIYGQVQRLQISSQALKRSVRTSPVMRSQLEGHMGTRTQQIGEQVREHLVEQGAEFDTAVEISKRLASVFGKIDDEALRGNDPKVKLRQLAFISPTEREELFAWGVRALAGEEIPADINRRVLKHHDQAVDIAMFGRMLANPSKRPECESICVFDAGRLAVSTAAGSCTGAASVRMETIRQGSRPVGCIPESRAARSSGLL